MFLNIKSIENEILKVSIDFAWVLFKGIEIHLSAGR